MVCHHDTTMWVNMFYMFYQLSKQSKHLKQNQQESVRVLIFRGGFCWDPRVGKHGWKAKADHVA